MRYALSFPMICLFSSGKLLASSKIFHMLISYSISATDFLEESLPQEPSWRSAETVKLARILATHGVDFLDVSGGGNHPAQKIRGVGTAAYQAPFAHDVKQALGDKLLVGSVGAITNGLIAEDVLEKGHADAVLVGRQFQKNPGSVWAFAEDLGVDIYVAHQIEWGTFRSTPWIHGVLTT
jgi:2,4-dienoyl-CoA reductase-like NADH-dependent reductase (Old Yellow Enzyme family)